MAKILLCLSFAAPQFHSWDLFWLFLAVELIKAREQAWASSFYSILASFVAYLAKNEGHTTFFLDFWINFSVIFHQFGCIPLAQRTQNAFRKSKPVFLDIEKKLHFLDFLWSFFFKIAVKSWIFPLKSCFIKKNICLLGPKYEIRWKKSFSENSKLCPSWGPVPPPPPPHSLWN